MTAASAYKVEVTDAPAEYNSEFCKAIRVGCAYQMSDIKEDVALVNARIDRIDTRMFTLILLAIGQILTITGALGYFILTRVNLVADAGATLVK